MTLNIMPMAQLLGAFIIPFGSYLTQYWDPRVMIILGESFALITLLIASLSQSFTVFALFYILSFAS